ncbi:MAG: helix-turn-helix domain-containing protein, partial [Desulfobacterales bacterium]|nr:helix-turn-helix domain-containing protein [Desulfobacterales bacterium]
ERVGDVKTYKANVRIVAATNADLQSKIKQGLFRQDLFYRLKVMPIKLPPLRERASDIPMLTRHFVEIFNESMRKSIDGVTDEVMTHFMQYSWPGNVRELKHAIEHACILCPKHKISLSHLPLELMTPDPLRTDDPTPTKKQAVEPDQILDALRLAEGNKAKAARLLGIGRVTLYRKLKEFNLDSVL